MTVCNKRAKIHLRQIAVRLWLDVRQCRRPGSKITVIGAGVAVNGNAIKTVANPFLRAAFRALGATTASVNRRSQHGGHIRMNHARPLAYAGQSAHSAIDLALDPGGSGNSVGGHDGLGGLVRPFGSSGNPGTGYARLYAVQGQRLADDPVEAGKTRESGIAEQAGGGLGGRPSRRQSGVADASIGIAAVHQNSLGTAPAVAGRRTGRPSLCWW